MSQLHLLSLLIALPMLGVVAIMAIPSGRARLVRVLGVSVLATTFGVTLMIWGAFDPSSTGVQLVDRAVWVRAFGIEYFVGVDQISFWLLPLTGLISLLAGIASLSIEENVRGYWAMYLLLNVGMYGVFVSLDFFLFYVFWELMLVPMYFLIGMWGGPRREYAAIKFFLYTLVGSVFLLLGMIALYFASDAGVLAARAPELAFLGLPATRDGAFVLADGTLTAHTFNMLSLIKLAEVGHWGHQAAVLGVEFTKLVWLGFFLGFAIKVPMFPFHTWLPDAHVEAPTPVSAILAGILLKTGTYGILRFNFQMLPDATIWARDGMALFGMINIVYAAFVCLAQKDLKKIIAYSSVSHMGFVLLGFAAMTPQGMSGAYFQMLAHGIISPLLFLIVGVLYDRAHTRDVDAFGGLAARMPEYAGLTGLAFFASLGLPGLAGFVGEILVFLGAFARYQVYTFVCMSSVVITAAYYLWTMQRIFLGRFNEAWAGQLPPLTSRERWTLYPLAAFAVVLGLAPMVVFDLASPGLNALLSQAMRWST